MMCFRKNTRQKTFRLTKDPVLPDGPVVLRRQTLNDDTDIDRVPQEEPDTDSELRKETNTDQMENAYVPVPRSGVASAPVKIDGDRKLSEFLNVPKSTEDEEVIKKALKNNEFLSKILSEENIKKITSAMTLRHVKANEVVIKQGDYGSALYVLSKGTYQVLVNGKKVGEYSDNRVFGELAILYNAKRSSTIKFTTKGEIWCLNRKTYQMILTDTNIKEEQELFNFLQNVKKLNEKEAETLKVVANLLTDNFFESGAVIVKEGDPGDLFYIIRAGTVTISKKTEGVISHLGKGDCFGELALQKEDIRQATVTADPPGVECLTLTRTHFQNYFGDIKITDIEVKRAKSIYEVQPQYMDISLGHFNVLGTLGVGGFGRVELVQHKKQKSLVFALKRMAKANIVQEDKQQHAYNEKYIQMNSVSPFIVRLFRTYKSKKYVYFLMEACLGGDLFSLLHRQKNKKFKNEDARFIISCIIEAIFYLHARGIAFRDLKPENVLIDKNGYFKLADFGFAKKLEQGSKTYTFVGTPEYTAPEVIKGHKGHDRAVDYWALGILIFELLVGKTPFYSGDPTYNKTLGKVLKGMDYVRFPDDFNNDARKLVLRLCKSNPWERLGMLKDGFNKIRKDKWFAEYDWKKLADCKLVSPFKPNLNSTTDLRYFPDQRRGTPTKPPDEMSGWDKDF